MLGIFFLGGVIMRKYMLALMSVGAFALAGIAAQPLSAG